MQWMEQTAFIHLILVQAFKNLFWFFLTFKNTKDGKLSGFDPCGVMLFGLQKKAEGCAETGRSQGKLWG